MKRARFNSSKTGQEALRGVRALLEYIGEDPDREGLRDTPGRVVRAWDEMCEGYAMDPAQILQRNFGANYNEMICVPNVEFFSTCEHHMLPFVGVAHVAYIPGVKPCRVVGLSKLARLVDCFARRLQIQEKMTCQIADAIEEHLKPRGVAVVVNARHMCMSCRGVKKQNSSMVTSAMRGAFIAAETRAEFLALVNSAKL